MLGVHEAPAHDRVGRRSAGRGAAAPRSCCSCWTTANTCRAGRRAGRRLLARRARAARAGHQPRAARPDRRADLGGAPARRARRSGRPSTRSGGRPRPGCSRRARPRSTAVSGSTSRPRRRWPQLCRRLDGLPLALELAATRVRALGVAASWLASTTASGCSPPGSGMCRTRQRTLTAVIAWSWDLLDPADRAVLAPAFGVPRTAARPRPPSRCATPTWTPWTGWWSGRWWWPSLRPPRHRLLESVAEFGPTRSPTPPRSAAGTPRTSRRWPSAPTRVLRGPEQQDVARDPGRRAGQPAVGARARRRPAPGARATWYWFLRGRLSEARRRAGADRHGRARAPRRRPGGSVSRCCRASRCPRTYGMCLRLTRPAGRVVRGRRADRPRRPGAGRRSCCRRSSTTRGPRRRCSARGPSSRTPPVTWRRWSAPPPAATRCFAELGDRWGRLQADDWLGGLAEMRGEHERAAAAAPGGAALGRGAGAVARGGRQAVLAGLARRADPRLRAGPGAGGTRVPAGGRTGRAAAR